MTSITRLLLTAVIGAATLFGCAENNPSCSPECGDFESCCDGTCVFLGSDPNNCGTCGNECTFENASGVCSDGDCTLGACTEGWSDCDGDPSNGCEVNTARADDNCGECGRVCQLPNATAVCRAGECVVGSCDGGWGDCNPDPLNGCESGLNSTSHCGGCDIPCSPRPNAVMGCQTGSCQLNHCVSGWYECDGNVENGCESSNAC